MVGVSRGVRRAWFVVVNTLVLLVALVAPAGAQNTPASPAEPADKVDAVVRERLDAVGEATFWVRLSAEADLSGAASIQDWAERGRFVYDALVENARDSQAGVTPSSTISVWSTRPIWVSNAIRVDRRRRSGRGCLPRTRRWTPSSRRSSSTSPNRSREPPKTPSTPSNGESTASTPTMSGPSSG